MFLFLKIENAKFHKFLYLIQYYFIYFIIFLYSWCVYLYKACSKWFHPIYNFVHCFYKTFYYLDTREFSSESCLHFTKIKKKQKGKVCWNQQLVRSNSYKYVWLPAAVANKRATTRRKEKICSSRKYFLIAVAAETDTDSVAVHCQ